MKHIGPNKGRRGYSAHDYLTSERDDGERYGAIESYAEDKYCGGEGGEKG